jgi:peptidyl-prolyl cis-trans isomerase SurA
MIKNFILLICAVLSINSFAQQDQEVLFTIDDEPVFASEFIRVYKKNLELVQDESQKDVDAYLDLFINYKLKLNEAKALGYDEKPTYKKELRNYRNQLAANFLTDTEVTEELVLEAYERTKYEVNADHILVFLSKNASPKDTLFAYNEIIKLRDRAVTEGFDKVRKEVHNGKTLFGEELGYFTAFKMVYDFESVAYDTPVGEISKPFRSRFGYHILKVNDKRESKGEVKVAHIMVALNTNEDNKEPAEERINDIYQKLNQGENFAELAKQFSDDRSSSNKGGELEPFKSGQLSSSEFEAKAFALKTPGETTEPFKTKFGWHIVKLIEKIPVASYEKLKSELEVKVKRDARANRINDSRIEMLKKRYSIQPIPEKLTYFESILNQNYFARKWILPEDFNGNQTLLSIQDKDITFEEFGKYIERSQRSPKSIQDLAYLVNELYNDFLNAKLLQYQHDNLENENQEFAQIVNEYREGLLLFDLMEQKIWNAAKTDTIQIEEYYQKNKKKYYWNERIDAIVASCSEKSSIKQVEKMLKAGKSVDEIKEVLNQEGKVNVIFTTGTMEADNQALPKNYKFQKGQSKIIKSDNSYRIVVVKEIIPVSLKSFEDAKGPVISDYQNYKEEMWLKNLRTTHNISINNNVLDNVKSKLKS